MTAESSVKYLRFCSKRYTSSAFSKTRLPPELRQELSCELPAVFLHFPLEEKGPWGPFYQLRQVLAKGRHLLQILLKALYKRSESSQKGICQTAYNRCTVTAIIAAGEWLWSLASFRGVGRSTTIYIIFHFVINTPYDFVCMDCVQFILHHKTSLQMIM